MKRSRQNTGTKSAWTTRFSVGLFTYPCTYIYRHLISDTAELNYQCSIADQEFDSHNNPVKLLLKGPIKEKTNGSLRVTFGDKVQTFIRLYMYFYKHKCVKTAR